MLDFFAAAAAISSRVSFLKYKRQLVDKTRLRKGQYISLTLGYARMEFHFIKRKLRGNGKSIKLTNSVAG